MAFISNDADADADADADVIANPNGIKIARSYVGDPCFGPMLETGQRRALLGWNHTNDTPAGLMTGSIWCWVSRVSPKFQVYDTSGNRSKTAGVVVDCGVANFTMVRMFHTFWCPYGRIPKDKNSADKLMCRHRYRMLVSKQREVSLLPESDESEPLSAANGAAMDANRYPSYDAVGWEPQPQTRALIEEEAEGDEELERLETGGYGPADANDPAEDYYNDDPGEAKLWIKALQEQRQRQEQQQKIKLNSPVGSWLSEQSNVASLNVTDNTNSSDYLKASAFKRTKSADDVIVLDDDEVESFDDLKIKIERGSTGLAGSGSRESPVLLD